MTEAMTQKRAVPEAIRAEMMTCPECGPQSIMLYDGGRVLEHELEGVWLELRLDGQDVVVSARSGDVGYLVRLNMKRVFEQVLEGLQHHLGGVYCPKCEEPLD